MKKSRPLSLQKIPPHRIASPTQKTHRKAHPRTHLQDTPHDRRSPRIRRETGLWCLHTTEAAVENPGASAHQLDAHKEIARNKIHVRKPAGAPSRVTLQGPAGTDTHTVHQENTLQPTYHFPDKPGKSNGKTTDLGPSSKSLRTSKRLAPGKTNGYAGEDVFADEQNVPTMVRSRAHCLVCFCCVAAKTLSVNQTR